MSAAGEVTKTVLIANQRGLHARASAKFVQLAEGFTARVKVARAEGSGESDADSSDESVNATSIMGLMMLGAACGTHITITAKGDDAAAALAALVGLVESKFNEE